MQFSIEVILSKVETKLNAKQKPYQQCELTYKRLDTGKVEAKKIIEYYAKDIFANAATAASGSQWIVTAEKGEQYWEWKGFTPIAPGGGQAPQAQAKAAGVVNNSTSTATRSTYETPEERAKKQVFIVKQSSLSNAIETLSVGAKSLKSEDVIALAQMYTDWVFDTKPTVPFADMEDDIPQ